MNKKKPKREKELLLSDIQFQHQISRKIEKKTVINGGSAKNEKKIIRYPKSLKRRIVKRIFFFSFPSFFFLTEIKQSITHRTSTIITPFIESPKHWGSYIVLIRYGSGTKVDICLLLCQNNLQSVLHGLFFFFSLLFCCSRIKSGEIKLQVCFSFANCNWCHINQSLFSSILPTE